MGSVGSTLFPQREPSASLSPSSKGGFKIRNQLSGQIVSSGGSAQHLKASATSASHRASSREGRLRVLYDLKTGVTVAIVSGERKPNDDRKKEENRDCRPVSYLISFTEKLPYARLIVQQKMFAARTSTPMTAPWIRLELGFCFFPFFFFKYRCEKSHLRDAKFIALGCSPGTRGFESSPRGSNAARFENHVPEHSTGCGAERQAPKTVCRTRGCRGAGHGVCCPQSRH